MTDKEKLDKALAFIESLSKRDKANGEELTKMWLRTYSKSDGIAFVYSFIAKEARELLEELEGE